MDRIVVYAATRNLYRNTLVCIESLLRNGNIDQVIMLAEDSAIKYPFDPKVMMLNVADQPWFDKAGPNASKRWTWMVLMKAALSKIFTEFDRVLFLDSDTIVEHDLSGLFELDLDGYYYAAVPQVDDGREGKFSKGDDYFNCGVLMCNLAELRARGMDDYLIQALNERSYEFCEQDAINEICRGRIKPLPGCWNVSDFTVPDTKTCIHHFAANPSWIFTDIFRKYDRPEEEEDE